MSIIRKPVKKTLWGLSLLVALALVFVVKVFGLDVVRLDKTPIAFADVGSSDPGIGQGCGNNADPDDGSGAGGPY